MSSKLTDILEVILVTITFKNVDKIVNRATDSYPLTLG